jgi:hypothetical protein
MATVSFIEKIKAMKATSFSFVDFEKYSNVDPQTGKKFTYLVLFLEAPLDKVITGTKGVEGDNGVMLYPKVKDCTQIQVSLDKLEKYQDEFVFEEDANGELTKAGSYNGDMFFDVSNSRKVWLDDVKMSQLSAQFKQNKWQEKRSKLVSSLMED